MGIIKESTAMSEDRSESNSHTIIDFNKILQERLKNLSSLNTDESLKERDLILKALQSGIKIQHLVTKSDIGQKSGSFKYRGYSIRWTTSVKKENEHTIILIFSDKDPEVPLFTSEFSSEDYDSRRPLPVSAENAVDLARCWVLMRTGYPGQSSDSLLDTF